MQKAILAGLLIQGCNGFVQNTAKAAVRPRSVSFSLPKEKINSDNNQSIDAFPDTDSYDIESSSASLPSNADPAEVLVESISRTTPLEVFKSVEEDATVQADSLFAESAMNNESDTERSENFLENFNDTSFENRDDDVKAVLEASGKAAAAAEASLSPELMKQLEFSKSNSTHAESVPDILSASSVVGEPATSTKIESPKVSKILKFAIPAIGVWLCGPLLSLIDTSSVGLFSGTIQQAALNPAVAVTDYAALLIAFMYTGATNLVAAAQETDRGTVGKPTTARVLIGSMRLSTYVGAGLGAILFVFARPLLKAIIGNDAISPAVFSAAMKYVRIRALGMPAAAIIGSTQAACLGMQDIRSPLYVLVAAAVVNFFGDVFFVGQSHPWLGGAAGAAWATVLSQYAGVFLFVKWLTHKRKAEPRVMNLSDAILEMTGKPSSKGESRREKLRSALQSFGTSMKTKKPSILSKLQLKKKSVNKKTAPKEESETVRGFLADRLSFRDLVKFPSAETRKDFAPYLAPVTATQVGRVSGYVAMSHVVASSLGTVSMAAQQVIVSLFYCLCPIADSLGLTAQSFVPGIAEKKPSKERSAALRQTALNFVKAGSVFGAAIIAIVGAIPLFSGMFTSDPAVIAMVNSVVPLLMVFFGVHGMLCASEGILLGQKDLAFLGRMYAAYFFAVPYFMLRVKKAALTGSRAVGLTSVWKVFIGYQVFRWLAWLGRVAVLQKRSENAASQLTEELSP
mmetsp:Transcript_72886/g.211012  ORF Transcript_72886/g.211012 Transcript_72886/m.211012 type:complete len:741 (-) Transcript_72886:107-2329(-)